jgi:hypothetical protein
LARSDPSLNVETKLERLTLPEVVFPHMLVR